jgi:hypothetical protein
MPLSTKLPKWRTWCGALIVTLAGIGCFICVSQLLLDLVPPHHLSVIRISVVSMSSVVALGFGALALRDTSILWQVGLRSIAIGGIVAGVALIVTSMIYNWHALLGYAG